MGTRSGVKARNRRLERATDVPVKPKRTPQKQLAHLDAMGFRALKERAKLEKRIDKEKEDARKKGKKTK